MLQTFKNAWKIPELKKKILFTLLIVIIYRIGANIPMPYVTNDIANLAQQSSGTIFEYLNILSGGAFAQATLFALGVSPYITSSIVIQLLTIAIPAVERWSKEGEEGKKKLNMATKITTVILALITSYGYCQYMSYYGVLPTTLTVFQKLVIVMTYCAGASIVMWIADLIKGRGIGNGISIILFVNIVAGTRTTISQMIGMVNTKTIGSTIGGIALVVASLLLTLLIVVVIVILNDSERRIPIQYAKRVVGRKMYGGQGTNLPIKLNMTGVMPIIFASSIVSIPATIGQFFPNSKFWTSVTDVFNFDTWLYVLIEFLLLIAFAYFYVAISFNPVEVSNNIKQQGGAIPGIRPGKPTSDFITKVLNRITLIGALVLAFICIFPMAISILAGGQFASLAFGGSSVIIVVGVALETVRELEAQMTLRNYKGFLD